jgi:hypothetical protein|tara:strand:+ start:457 stop:630 length:174 start_codon:yes stop_codon:yes gene_type:complete
MSKSVKLVRTLVMTAVDKEYLKRIEEDSHMLECLDACGVLDWEGYKEAKEMYDEEKL